MKNTLVQAVKLTSLGLLAGLLTEASYATDPAKVNTPPSSAAPAAPAVSPGAQKAVETAKAKEAPSTAPLAEATQNADQKMRDAIKNILAGVPDAAKKAADDKIAKQGAVPSEPVKNLSDASGASAQGLKFTQAYDDDRCYDAADNYICDDDGNPMVPGAPAPAPAPAPNAPAAAPIDPITKAVNDAIRASINETEKSLEAYKAAQATFVAAVAANNLEQVIATGPAYKDALVKATASVAAALNILLKDSAKSLLGADSTAILNDKYTKAKAELDAAAGLGK